MALTGTQNYIPWISVTMASIMEHNSSPFAFHILVDKTDEADIEKLQKFSIQWNVPITLYYMNDANLSQYCRFERYRINGKYVAALMYRFFIPELLKDKAERALYLDGDVVCNGDITSFMDIDLQQNIVAVSEDLKGQEYAARMNVERYFNSGVILVDIQQWLSNHISKRILDDLRIAAQKYPEMSCPDQDILNVCLDGKDFFVPHTYNLPYRLVQPSVFKPKIVNEDAMQASLIHFIGAIKPWTTYNQSVPIVKVWAHAKENSPWRDVPIHEPGSQKAFHQAARDARRRHAYKEMVLWYFRFIKSKFDGTRKVGY